MHSIWVKSHDVGNLVSSGCGMCMYMFVGSRQQDGLSQCLIFV